MSGVEGSSIPGGCHRQRKRAIRYSGALFVSNRHGRACHRKSGLPDLRRSYDRGTRASPSSVALYAFIFLIAPQDVYGPPSRAMTVLRLNPDFPEIEAGAEPGTHDLLAVV